MGTVTEIDFQARAEATGARHPRESVGWADRVADAWYSPIGRAVAVVLTLGVIMTGLGIGLFWLLLLMAIAR